MLRRALAFVVFLVFLAPAIARAQAAEIPPIIAGPYSCHIGEHGGIDDADARTSTDLICSELGRAKATPGAFEVRFGKLGSRVLLGIRERATGEDRRLLIQSLDEVPVAAPRLAAAISERVTFEQTQNVDNVVSADARKPKTKPLAGSGSLGLVGMVGAGEKGWTSAGFELGLGLRKERFALGGHLRAGGIGSSDRKLGFVGIDAGLKYFFTDADFSPFIGGGLGVSYLKASRPTQYDAYSGYDSDENADGSGFGAYVEGGVNLFRSSHAGAALALRVDAPFFALKGTRSTKGPSRVDIDNQAVEKFSLYVVPISVTLGFTFQ